MDEAEYIKRRVMTHALPPFQEKVGLPLADVPVQSAPARESLESPPAGATCAAGCRQKEPLEQQRVRKKRVCHMLSDVSITF